MARLRARSRRALRLTRWMRRLPFGELVFSFWFTVLDDGIRDAVKPRWGALTFSFLNDGAKPSLWHTWYGITHGPGAPYSAIYPGGAPRSLEEAKHGRVGAQGGEGRE